MTLAKRTRTSYVSRLILPIAAIMAIALAGFGVLSATAQGEDTIIYGCVHGNSGAIRIVGDASACRNNETLLTWSPGGTATAVHWDDIEGIPPGVQNPVAEDVQCTGCVDSADIENFGVQTEDLADDSIQTSKLKDLTVTSVKLANGSVTTDKLGPSAVTSEVIANGSITFDDLGSNSVTNDKIVQFSITHDKLAEGSVGGAAIQNGSITSEDLADGSVTGDKLAGNSVSSASIVDGSITGADVADESLTGVDIADGSVATNDVKANTATGQPTAMLEIPGTSGMHAVMVFGDAKVICNEPGGCNGAISWQVRAGFETFEMRSMTVVLQPGEEIIISAQDLIDLGPGTHAVEIDVSFIGFGATTISLYSVIAVDLGSSS